MSCVQSVTEDTDIIKYCLDFALLQFGGPNKLPVKVKKSRMEDSQLQRILNHKHIII